MLEVLANLLKVKKPNKNLTCIKEFTASSQYFVEAPLAEITASSLSEYDATSLAYL